MHEHPSPAENHWFSTSNPLAQQIPYYSDPEQLASDLAFNPVDGLDLANLSITEIDELLIGEKTPLEPTMQIIRTALTWHSMLHAGLRRRNPNVAKARQLYWEAVLHKPNGKTHPFMSPTRGISVQVVKGTTGTGKSVTMARFCKLFPQVIRHGANSIAGWEALTQLVYLEVAISHDGTRGGFLTNILVQIDIALGTSYAIDLPRKHKTVERLAVATVCRLVAHYTGILFLEEGQLRNLVLSGQANLMQDFLLMLMNSGIPIVFLGNEAAFNWITYSQDSNRLYTTPSEHFMPTGAIAMNAEAQEEATMEWDAIARGIMSYYCLTLPISDPEECKKQLRKCSGGIPRLALFLWCMAQRNALFQGQESFGSKDISLVYESSAYKEHRNLADGFYFRKSDLLQDIEDVDTKLYDTYWGSVTREPTVALQTTAQVRAAQKGESKENEIKKKTPVKAPKSGRAKFKAEQTRQKNQDAKRNELLKNLPDGDIRSSGLVAHHLKGFQDALAAARGAE
ncbi:MAG: hypothetical protein RLZZ298_392 [Pseudomonadota bacterium]|jgi:hypothetical protein